MFVDLGKRISIPSFVPVVAFLLFLVIVPRLGLAAQPVLVDTEWVSQRLDDPSVVLVDMAVDPAQYQRFHLPGAVYLSYAALVQTRRDGVTLRVSDEHLFKILGTLGISAESHVVVYDDMGGLQAGRLFWELEQIGHEKISVLDGGLVQWILEGRKVEGTPVRPKPVSYKPAQSRRRDNEASLDDIKTASASGAVTLLDVRTQEEYQGNPKSRERTGHIPGAQWWPWDQSVDFQGGFRLKQPNMLQDSLAKIGAADKGEPVITYCRSGHRAAQSYLTLRALGYENVRLYDGSMLEYQLDRNAPLRLGSNP